MSVQAVNNVDAQQPQKSNATGTAIAGALPLGLAGAGYMWGGKTPSLEEVFAQEPDTFKASMDRAAENDSAAAQILRDEMKAIEEDATVKPKKEIAEGKINEVKTAIESRTDYENKAELDKAVNEKQKALNNKEIDVVDPNNSENTRKLKYNQAKAELEAAQNKVNGLAENAAEDVKNAAQTELETAKANIAKFDNEVNELKQAKDAVFEAKSAKFEADDATKVLREEASNAVEELTNARKGLIDKLTDKNTVTDAFGKIKKALTEGKWTKGAALWGGIAAAVGLIAGYMLCGSKKAE